MLSLLQHQGGWVEFKEMKSAPCQSGGPHDHLQVEELTRGIHDTQKDPNMCNHS